MDQEKRREENEGDDAGPPRDRKIQMSGNRRDVSPTEPKARTRTEHDRGDLPERSGEKNNDRNRGKRDASAGAIGGEGSRHAPDGLCDDRNRDELEAVQETFGNRSREYGCAHRKGDQDQSRGRGEGEPRRKATQKAIAAQNAEGKADLAGGRSGKELAERDQLSIGRLVEPFAPFDELIAEIAEMSDWTAKRGQAKF
jgi:hypothetical protein